MLRLFSALFLLFGLQRISASHWSYPDRDLNEAFPNWGGICDTGKRQSPINLSKDKSLKGVFDKLKFENFNERQNGVTLVNNGHSIVLSNFSKQMEVKGGPLLDEYVVEQLHLHWWSEHTINNMRYPLEVHIVSRNKRYANVSMATNFKEGLTVIGVLYHVSNERSEAIEQIIEHLQDVKDYEKLDQPAHMKQSFVVRQLFPKLNGYITYSGSLTTPSCAEAVTWIILSETFPVTLAQVDSFKDTHYEANKVLKSNYRDIQKSYNRPVIFVDDVVGAANHMQVSVGAIIFMFIAIKFM
ncbi:putative carbonic anhydrase 3 isoform X1 [Eurosta solidaginis]|uniref:putative carbonic anhydrase 3 isoform X1 n=1 Tax=Eurosta solidaginis TaxID=178769 RepID=UPI003530831C